MTDLTLFLIEEMGGYDKAKIACKTPFPLFNVHTLERQLLEYRRIHNIFEVGDLIVAKEGDSSELLVIDRKGADGSFFDEKWRRLNIELFRPATDAEILAGKRLNETLANASKQDMPTTPCSREAFEQWVMSKSKIAGYLVKSDSHPFWSGQVIYEVWQAQQAEIDALRAEIAEYKKLR